MNQENKKMERIKAMLLDLIEQAYLAGKLEVLENFEKMKGGEDKDGLSESEN